MNQNRPLIKPKLSQIGPKLTRNRPRMTQNGTKFTQNRSRMGKQGIKKDTKLTNNQSKIDHLVPKCLPHYRFSQDGESTLSRFECIFLLLG